VPARAPSLAARAGRELAGGAVTAVVALALALSFGLLAFAALGPAFTHYAVAAGLLSAIIGLGLGALLDHSGRTLYGPRSSTALLLASLVLAVVADPALASAPPAVSAAFVLGIAGVAVGLSGLLKIAFALFGVARLARYVPYPFLAGFMCGIAGLIVLKQVPVLLGAVDLDFSTPLAFAASVDGGAARVGIVTIGAIEMVDRRWPRLPALAVGLCAGVACYAALSSAWPGLDFGRGASAMDAAPPLVFTPLLLADAGFRAFALSHGEIVLTTALLIAAIGGLDGLLSTVAVDAATGGERDNRRELMRQGLANVACGLVGALPVAMSVNNVLGAWRSGARTSFAGLGAALLLVLLLARGAPLLQAVPQAVLAGVMVAIAGSLVDRWTRAMVSRARAPEGRRDPALMLSLGVVAIVALATMFASMIAAVAVGLVLSMAVVVASMHERLVRKVVTARARPSRRVWPAAAAEALARSRERIRIVELEGALFFGSAERLGVVARRIAHEADFIVIDFDRVTALDATGALLLDRLATRLAARGCRVLLAGVTREGRHGKALAGSGAFADSPEPPWFVDVDRAVEHAEATALAASGHAARSEMPLAQTDLATGLAPAEIARLEAATVQRALAAGEVLFREHEAGDALYVILHGAVTVTITLPGGRESRIATFAAGAVLGETALLDGRPRSGTATAASDAILAVLTRETLERLRATDGALVAHVFANLARLLALRLRITTDALRRLEDSFG
jgi:MFS superfamily sulfate permease-like transporter/CRP-like cAMP-binding protein